jgi:hypothetical protein
VSEHATNIFAQEYVHEISFMREYDMNTVYINYDHLNQFDAPLAVSVKEEFYRYVDHRTLELMKNHDSPTAVYCRRFEPYLRRALMLVVRDIEPEYAMKDGEFRDFYVAFYNMTNVFKYV